MIKIDKGIPLAENGAGRGGIYPFQEMSVGDSFFAPRQKHNTMSGAAHYAKKRTGYKFALRQVTENGVDGIRVWRTK